MSMEDDNLQLEAEVLAGEYKVDKNAVHKALREISGAYEYFPRTPVQELRVALDSAPPERVLDLFQDEPADIISVKVIWYHYLSSPLTPLYTLSELARLLREFALYLDHNEDHLLKMGHPNTRFDTSPWLDWHLARTYYTKRPIIVAPGRREFAELFGPPLAEHLKVQEKDAFGNTVCQYLWTRQRPRPPFPTKGPTAETRAITEKSGKLVAQEPFDFSSFSGLFELPVDGRRIPVDFCDYGNAGHMKGFSDKDVVWLKEMRPKVLDLKKNIVGRLRAALDQQDAEGLWEDISDMLTSSLSQQEAERLIEAERFYGSTSSLVLPLWAMDVPLFYENNGGLTELLAVIGHVEKELRIGTMRGCREILGDKHKVLELNHYYQAIDEPWRPLLDQAIVTLLALSVQEDEFWKGYQTRVHELGPRFRSKVIVSRLVVSDKAHKLLSYLEEEADWARLCLEQTGEVQDKWSSAAEQTAQYVFRKDRDAWCIVFAGQKAPAEPLVGVLGMDYIHTLLSRPNKWVSCLELVGVPCLGPATLDAKEYKDLGPERLASEGLHAGNLQELLRSVPAGTDAKVFDAAIKTQQCELQAARTRGDIEEIVDLQGRIEKLQQLRSALFNVRGEERPMEHQRENARTAVQKAIARALEKICRQHTDLGEHLKSHIETGAECCYKLAPNSKISWNL